MESKDYIGIEKFAANSTVEDSIMEGIAETYISLLLVSIVCMLYETWKKQTTCNIFALALPLYHFKSFCTRIFHICNV